MKPTRGSKSELRRWAAAWKKAGALNRAVRQRELRQMTDAEAWRKSDDLLSGPRPWRPPGRRSGLLDQQRIFRRLAGR